MRANKNKSKLIKSTSGIGGRGRHVTLNGELLEKVKYFKYLGSKITVYGGIETEVKSRKNEIGKVSIEIKRYLVVE